MILYLAIFVGTVLAMEGVAWLMHKYLMHGPLWVLHEAFFLLCFAAQIAGFFMIVLRIKPIMHRLREFEALPPQG